MNRNGLVGPLDLGKNRKVDGIYFKINKLEKIYSDRGL